MRHTYLNNLEVMAKVKIDHLIEQCCNGRISPQELASEAFNIGSSIGNVEGILNMAFELGKARGSRF